MLKFLRLPLFILIAFLLTNNKQIFSQPIVVDAGPDTTICGSGSVTIGGNPTMSGGTMPYSYTWTPATGLSNPNVANPVATVSVTTTYIVTTSDFNGRGGMDTMTITVMNASDVKFAGIPNICENDTFLFLTQGTPTGGVYSGPGIVTSPKLNPALAGPGMHTITYTYMNPSCTTSFSQTQTLVIDTAPDIIFMVDPDTICEGDTAFITAGGAANYLWQPTATIDDSTAKTVKAFPITTTRYYVTGTAGNGCSRLDSVILFVDPCLPDGVNEHSDGQWIVFPHPVSDQLNISTSGFIHGPIDIYLYDLQGALVHQDRSAPSGNNLAETNISGLKPGMYILKVSAGTEQKIIKILKQ